MIEIYFGDGKGKTTAAVGLAVRACGYGLPVTVAQFLKTDRSGERAVLRNLPGVTVLEAPEAMPFLRDMTEAQRTECAAVCRRLFEQAASVTRGVVIFDELLDAVAAGLVPEADAAAYLKRCPTEVEAVLTGHTLPEGLEPLADYITEMKAVRHPYERGIAARPGIEY